MQRSWICSLAGIVLLASGLAGQLSRHSFRGPRRLPWYPASSPLTAKRPFAPTVWPSKVAERLQATLKAVQGLDLKTRRCERAGIALVLSAAAPVADTEGYTLDVDANGIRIVARAEAGLYYGAMTAAQLLSAGAAHNSSVRLAGMHIEDFPRFKWRGLMLDPARHFLPPADVKTIIEQMGQHKLNVLHLHLTDDQGWRIEIKRYPRAHENRRLAYAAIERRPGQ